MYNLTVPSTLKAWIDFIPELTFAMKRAWGPEAVRRYEASRARAHEDAVTKAKELAARFA
ncbi:hypothetical protein AB0383_23415 [Amycolatopsis sp. NPDC051373]|uniref:hypothetical protein n=1 Tax=Amycolatopsis sp. NPDC051373 TaxID=3155801 RepID=UPI00344F66C6